VSIPECKRQFDSYRLQIRFISNTNPMLSISPKRVHSKSSMYMIYKIIKVRNLHVTHASIWCIFSNYVDRYFVNLCRISSFSPMSVFAESRILFSSLIYSRISVGFNLAHSMAVQLSSDSTMV
jgi:hypothetical protein